jgi:hypothetical protein
MASVSWKTDHLNGRPLPYECRHAHQVEQAGSLTTFLSLYLNQIAQYGYIDAPFEIDARAHEYAEWP